MQLIDIEDRDSAIFEEGNIVISASAGTGKTYTTIERIKNDKENNMSYQTFAAVTFTRKAAKEIKMRLGPNIGVGFVGTNDTFVLAEIIQPFMYDVYGYECKYELKTDYTDENQVRTFEEGVKRAKETRVVCKYENQRENFAFQLALNILKNSESARMYLMSKYYRIYIDEYQDSDKDMHKFFMYLSDDLNIPLFIVGDEKQSIYAWRGAYSSGFTSLFNKEGFKKFELMHNFRSVKAIQNYANIFLDNVRGNYNSIEFKNEVQLLKFDIDNNATNYIKEWLDSSKNCAFLNYGNAEAKRWSENLNNMGLDFKYISSSPLDYSNMESEHIWICRALANYFYNTSYSEYDFWDETVAPEKYKIAELRDKIKAIFGKIEDYEGFKDKATELYRYLDFVEDDEKIHKEIRVLYKVVTDEQYEATYNQSKYRHTSGTIHSSKGLEFKQVIINAENYGFSDDENRFLHYVAVTRPEERLLILAKRGWRTNKYIAELTRSIVKTKQMDKDINIDNVVTVVEL